MSLQSLVILLITTLAPVAIVGWYIYRKDQYKPEPLKVLFITAFCGFLGGLFASMLTKVGLNLPEIYVMQEPIVTIGTPLRVMQALCIGDIIMMLILAGVAIFNRMFDEQVDGIVYSVFIALGFILCQNIIYLLYKERSLVDADSLRALFLIPIYFFYAILSGYYFSRVCYRRPRWNWPLIYDLVLFFFYPFLWHTMLVTLLLVVDIDINAWLGIFVFLVLTCVCFMVMNYGIQRIESHLARDVREGGEK